MLDERSQIERMLKLLRHNLATLEVYVANHGGKIHAPLDVQNQLNSIRELITLREAELARFGEPASLQFPISGPVRHLPSLPEAISLEFAAGQSFDSKLEAHITWRSSLFGSHETTFKHPFDQENLSLVIRALDVLQYPSYPDLRTARSNRSLRSVAAISTCWPR